jgi:hypothetical protein
MMSPYVSPFAIAGANANEGDLLGKYRCEFAISGVAIIRTGANLSNDDYRPELSITAFTVDFKMSVSNQFRLTNVLIPRQTDAPP